MIIKSNIPYAIILHCLIKWKCFLSHGLMHIIHITLCVYAVENGKSLIYFVSWCDALWYETKNKKKTSLVQYHDNCFNFIWILFYSQRYFLDPNKIFIRILFRRCSNNKIIKNAISRSIMIEIDLIEVDWYWFVSCLEVWIY